MKILHALVGYLAVTALPFHPFAFASPLAAIGYDGYVDITQNGALMKRVLGSGTSQTVTTQNHSHSALVERVAIAVPAGVAILALVRIVLFAVFWIKGDDKKREAFTQGTINKAISEYPGFNWVVCHSDYLIGFDGVEGTDWGYTHHELGISFFRTIGYDLYWARSGTFYRLGDGGFINWAYYGNIIGRDDGGATVHFGVIS